MHGTTCPPGKFSDRSRRQGMAALRSLRSPCAIRTQPSAWIPGPCKRRLTAVPRHAACAGIESLVWVNAFWRST